MTLLRFLLLTGLGCACALPAPGAARAAPLPADPAGVWTLQDENASVSSNKVTDRYYTNGLRLGYASPTGGLPAGLAETAQKLWGDGARRWTIDLTHQLHTPYDTKSTVAPRGDYPYSAIMMATGGLTSDTATHRSALTVGIGMIGPSAGGQSMQNGFHDLIGQGRNRGWGRQIGNEPVVQITSSRVYRVKLVTVGPLETDLLPDLTAGVGTVRDYIETGMTVRLGQGLDADFGVARLRPGLSGGDGFRPSRDVGWYVFAGVDGQAVLRDITIDGDVFRNGPHAKRQVFMGEAQGGFGLLVLGARVTYTHVVQTEQFKSQKGGLHQFGSLAVSVRF